MCNQSTVGWGFPGDYVSSCVIPLMRVVVYKVVGFARGDGRHSAGHRRRQRSLVSPGVDKMSSKLESDVCCRLQVAPPGESYEGKRRPGGKQWQTTAGYMA